MSATPDNAHADSSLLCEASTTPAANGVRHDSFTFAAALDYVREAPPRVLYLGLGETDDWAHDGRYDRVLQSLQTVDGYLRTLWTWLQAQDDYRDRTALVVTVDHGRGRSPPCRAAEPRSPRTERAPARRAPAPAPAAPPASMAARGRRR